MTEPLAFIALLSLAVLGVLVYLERRDLLPEWVSLLAGGLLVAGVALVGLLWRAMRPSVPRRTDAPQTPYSATEHAEITAAKARLAEANERLAKLDETTDPDERSEALSDLLNGRKR